MFACHCRKPIKLHIIVCCSGGVTRKLCHCVFAQAKSGQTSVEFLEMLMKDEFLSRPPPKSTGREVKPSHCGCGYTSCVSVLQCGVSGWFAGDG